MKHFLIEKFYKDYYIPSVLVYSKPIKTNVLKHTDISVFIDPFVESFDIFITKYGDKIKKYYPSINQFLYDLLIKYSNYIKNNKKLFPIYIDVRSYFLSKISNIVKKIDKISTIKAYILDENHNINDQIKEMKKLLVWLLGVGTINQQQYNSLFTYTNSLCLTDNIKTIYTGLIKEFIDNITKNNEISLKSALNIDIVRISKEEIEKLCFVVIEYHK